MIHVLEHAQFSICAFGMYVCLERPSQLLDGHFCTCLGIHGRADHKRENHTELYMYKLHRLIHVQITQNYPCTVNLKLYTISLTVLLFTLTTSNDKTFYSIIDIMSTFYFFFYAFYHALYPYFCLWLIKIVHLYRGCSLLISYRGWGGRIFPHCKIPQGQCGYGAVTWMQLSGYPGLSCQDVYVTTH